MITNPINNNLFKVEGYISVKEASRRLGYCYPMIIKFLKSKKLKGKVFTWKVRRVQMVLEESLKTFEYTRKRVKPCRPEGWLVEGGVTTINGYRYVHKPSHPRCNQAGYVAEHHLVMEKKLGRFLTSTEVVHHVNRERGDNRPSNLVVYGSSGEHLKAEHSEFMSLVLQIRGNPILEQKAIKALNKVVPTPYAS